MKTIIGKITIDILTSIYQPFWFAILLSIMTMFFYLYVKCPEGAGKGWKAAIRTWIVHFKRDREFRKKYILFFYITMVLFKTLINRDMWMNPLCDVWGVWGIYKYSDRPAHFNIRVYRKFFLAYAVYSINVLEF